MKKSKSSAEGWMNQLQKGPCIHCGSTNYRLSCGGHMICPPCDLGKNPNCEKCKESMRLMDQLKKDYPKITGEMIV